MKRILIIDDEPGICQVVQVAFKVMTQWEVLVANSSQAGIAIAGNRTTRRHSAGCDDAGSGWC